MEALSLDRTPLVDQMSPSAIDIKCVCVCVFFVSLQGLYQLLETSVVIRTRRADVANVKVSVGNVVRIQIT